MSGGSIQLRTFRQAIRDGESVERAAQMAGIGIAEARLTLKADEADPPPAEAYEMIEASARAPIEQNAGLSHSTETFMPKHDDTAIVPDDNDPLIELAADTLRGDIRDSLLDWFKAQPKAWPFMAEREQRDLADAVDRYSYQLIKQAASIIAAGERPCIVAKLVEYREKDGVEAKLKLASKGEVVAQLHEACGREVLLVASGAENFEGEAGPPEIDPDQKPLKGIGDEYDEAA